MKLDDLSNLAIDDADFMSKFILPAHYPLAINSEVRFSIQDCSERVIICSSDHAKDRGFKDVKAAINKQPDIDFQRNTLTGRNEFNIHINYLKAHKKSTQYVYRNKKSNILFLTTSEPIINFAGEVIGRKDNDAPFRMISHRDVIERHFKNYGVDTFSMENLTNIQLSEQEELVIFMLIGGYSQQEIADFMKISRGMVSKIIAEKLCVKFEMTIISTKLLIEKAVSCGFANIIPEKFFAYLNSI